MPKNEARRKSRILVVEALFCYLFREKRKANVVFNHVLKNIEQKKQDPFAKSLFTTAVKNLTKLKLILKVFAPEYPFEKIAPINRTLIMLGLSEMKFTGTPPVVVINEYIELAKIFGEHKSAGFINAVLDSFRKNTKLDTK